MGADKVLQVLTTGLQLFMELHQNILAFYHAAQELVYGTLTEDMADAGQDIIRAAYSGGCDSIHALSRHGYRDHHDLHVYSRCGPQVFDQV